MAERSVGVRELRQHLSRYLRQVQASQTIIVTERGEPIAHLLPVALPLEERLQAMIRAGLAAWNGKSLRSLKPAVRLRGAMSIADFISEDRE